ncbi:MAG TPA: cobyrinic acid a,c-diamide synthase [Pedococcus sp.]|nr:cobyrinic acid a,c-diamide synthase [Pedococcus sp.]
MSVPGADDIFRPTAVPPQPVVELKDKQAADAASPPEGRTASGRVRHDEKMTVYVTSEELLDIEHARLDLRRHHGLAVDRGRIVRAAVALALEDLDEHGADSALVQRLSSQSQ